MDGKGRNLNDFYNVDHKGAEFILVELLSVCLFWFEAYP